MNKYPGAFRQYIQDISQYDQITEEEEQKLFKAYIETGDPVAQDKIFKGNLRLVIYLARKYDPYIKSNAVGLDLEDLIQVGNDGLMYAITKYDPAMGTKFSTYAGQWIKQRIRRELTNQSRSMRKPANQVNRQRAIAQYRESYFQAHEFDPTTEDVAEHFNMSVADVEKLLYFSDVAELDEPLYNDEGEEYSLKDEIKDGAPSMEKRMIREEQAKAVRAITGVVLTPVEEEIIRLCYGMDSDKIDSAEYTFEELGNKYGKTRQWAKVVHDQALDKLKEAGELKKY